MRLRVGSAVTVVALAVAHAGGAAAIDTGQMPFETKVWRLPGPVYSLAQTADGFLWLGTESGLRRFDGVDFSAPDASITQAFVGDHCRKIVATRDGALWVATGRAYLRRFLGQMYEIQWKSGRPGLGRYRDGVVTNFSTRDGLPSDWVFSLAEDASGALYIGTEAGLARWSDGKITKVPFGDPANPPAVLSIHIDKDGALWLGTTQGLWVAREGRVAPTAVTTPIVAVVRDRRGTLWLGGLSSVIRYLPSGTTEILTGAAPVTLFVDRDDNLWVGAEDGLFRYDPSHPEGPLLRTDLERWVLSLLEDREGSLWAGTRTGNLTQIRPPEVRNIGQAEGLAGDMGFTSLVARDGSVWVTTGNGISHFVDGKITSYRMQVDFPARDLRSLAEGPDGSIWVTSWKDGLLRFQDGHIRRYTTHDGLAIDAIRSVHIDGRGRLWLSFVERPGAARYDQGEPVGKPVEFTPEQGLCPLSQRILATGKDDRIWLGGERGLSLIEGDRARCFTTRDGLPADTITAAYEDPSGTLWFGVSSPITLVRYRNGVFTSGKRRAAGTPNATLFQSAPLGIVDDGRGRFWMTTLHGVLLAEVRNLDAYLDGRSDTFEAFTYTAEDGMRSPECTAWFNPPPGLDRRGHLWVPTLSGVSVLAPPESQSHSYADVFLDRVLVDGLPVAGERAPVTLPRGGGDLEVFFTAPSFARQNRLRFAYKLEGFDTRWVEAGTRRQVRYPRVSPGHYVLKVAVRDHTGRSIGKAVNLAVVAPPFFHQTPAFFVLCALALALGVFGLHRLRVRQIEGRHIAVLAERARIARDIHDNLGQAFASIGLLIDGAQVVADDTARVRDMLKHGRRVVDLAHDETRRSIWNIRTKDPGPSPLSAILQKIVDGFPRSAGLTMDVAASSDPIPPLLRLELEHIVREAVSNAIRHAQAASIRVEAHTDAEGLAVRVKDDGCGFSGDVEPGAGRGIGLLGMKERASRLGGVLAIVRGEDKGTEVSLFVPRIELEKLSKGSA